MAHVYVDKHAAANQSLLAPIPPEQQLNLRWQRVCAFVSTDYDGEAAGSFLSDALKRVRGQAVPKAQKKQVSLRGTVRGVVEGPLCGAAVSTGVDGLFAGSVRGDVATGVGVLGPDSLGPTSITQPAGTRPKARACHQ